MGTLKIGSASNRKGVTIEPSVVLFNGNNVVSIKSGSTEIWSNEKPLQLLIPKMTSNTSPSGEAFTQYTTSTAYQAFDRLLTSANPSYGCHLGDNVTSSYVGYDFKKQVKVKQAKIYANSGSAGLVLNFMLQGSNGDSWYNLGEKTTSLTLSTANTVYNCTIDLEKAFSYSKFRLNVTGSDTLGQTGRYGTQIVEMELYGW